MTSVLLQIPRDYCLLRDPDSSDTEAIKVSHRVYKLATVLFPHSMINAISLSIVPITKATKMNETACSHTGKLGNP